MSNQPKFSPLTHLGDLPIDLFLRDYWQQKPLLIRQAFANFQSPISADELAGLALEEGVAARLVEETPRAGSRGNWGDCSEWKVTHGPLDENIFSTLPEEHWTLLVQHVDSFDPEVAALLDAFRFIPNWRLDDIMISYATDKGGVGPHFDYFDVFLLQTQGKRRWRLGQVCDANSPLVPNLPMKLLQDFETREDWIVEPGDLLYIPAGTAHWGEAIGECMTWSIGFRAPSHAEILLDFAQEAASWLGDDERYRDPCLSPATQPGLIDENAITQLKAILAHYTANDAALKNWLGQYSTILKQPIEQLVDPIDADDLPEIQTLRLHTFCRAAYTEHEGQVQAYINGEVWECSLPLAQLLSRYQAFDRTEFVAANDQLLIRQLAEQGWLEIID